ncbi:MAG: RNA polymerase subunit sigma [Bacteroidetes bacterium]|nr:MAG: RNA polymerase subunit sigma [Bacteroidota bacterium]
MSSSVNQLSISKAVKWLKQSNYTTAFTGAGISVESGIPPFRGEDGLWSKYDPIVLDLDYFHTHPAHSWDVIKEIFYDFFGEAKANAAHIVLAKMEAAGFLKNIITQNIDNLHQEAGSKAVIEFHGNSRTLVCTGCHKQYSNSDFSLDELPLRCEDCNALIKPDFIFFGEGIPPLAYQKSIEAAEKADVFLLIGTTGEVMPASQIPHLAKSNGAKIIEVNPNPSNYTHQITDIFLQGKATEVMGEILENLIQTS